MKVTMEIVEHDLKSASFPNGWQERFYHCPVCKLRLGRTCHSSHRFGHSTILTNNIFPKFCPKCGTALDYSNVSLYKEDILE